MLVLKPEGLFAGHPYVWADWSLHIGLASAFLHRPLALWFSNHLLYAGMPLNYPFVTNLISAMLMKFGISLQLAFIVPSFIFSIWLVVGLYVYFYTLSRRMILAIGASYLFLCSGGLGFFLLLAQNKSLAFLFDSSVTLTQTSLFGIEFTNVLLGMLIPQRAFLLGMPIGLGILIVLTRLFLRRKVSYTQLVFSGVLAGLLPLIHTHTFLLIVFFSMWLCLPTFFSRTKEWFFYGLPAVLLSLCVYWIFLSSTVSGSAFFTYHPGWYVQTGLFDWLVFWIKNWGVVLPLSILGIISIKPKSMSIVYIWFGWLLVFILANIFQFQPQTWDNSKLLAWSYLGLSLPAFWAVIHLFGEQHKRVIAAVLFFLCISGGIDLVHMLDFEHKSYQIISTDEIALGNFVAKNTPPDAVIVTSDWVTNPVTIIGGRSIILGYPGWIFNYGFPYQEREKDLEVIYHGGQQSIERIQKYNASFLLIGANESKFTPDKRYFDQSYQVVFSNDGGTLYRVGK